MRVRMVGAGLLVGAVLAGTPPVGATEPSDSPSGPDAIPVGDNWLLSRTPDGKPGNWSSSAPSISDDGRWVAFDSNSSDLVPGDQDERDVFLLDRSSGAITLISETYRGQPKRGAESSDPMISADGRYVVYSSWVDKIVRGDENGFADIFRYDRVTGGTALVSRNSDGVQGTGPSTDPAVSADGSMIAFESQSTNLDPDDVNGIARDVFYRDLETGTTGLVSHKPNGKSGQGWSTLWSISADGRTVGFSSDVKHLTPDDVRKHTIDAFAFDVATDSNELVSTSTRGKPGDSHSPGGQVSADGRYVAFASDAANLVKGDGNQSRDVFVRDRETGTTTLVSRTSAGELQTGASFAATISDDGRFVLIASEAPLEEPIGTPGRRQVYVHDRDTGATTMISRGPDGAAGDDHSHYFLGRSDFTADNRFVVYGSLASNLTAQSDENTHNDVFLHRLS